MTTPALGEPIQLPSGAVLRIQLAPFAEAKALYQAILREMKDLNTDIGKSSEIGVEIILMRAMATGFSSPDIERAVEKCMSRCLYNGEKLTMSCFEPIESRDDYIKVYAEVIRENVAPFLKSLFAEFKTGTAMAGSILKSSQETMTTSSTSDSVNQAMPAE